MSSSPSRIVCLAVGGALLLVGSLGFTANAERWLFGFVSVNVAQNLLHLVIGAALIASAFSPRVALLASLLGTLLLIIGIAGLFIINTPFNVIAVNGAANLLHFVGASVLLAVGLGARR